MTKIMYVGEHETVDIPTLEEKSPGRIGRGQGADVDPALAANSSRRATGSRRASSTSRS
jgi:hypothetical protein